jgi:hypothetical protein
VRLLPFWAKWPAVWFAQAEAQFSLAGISSERTKFFHVILQLDHRYTAEVEDVISPPERGPYTTQRAELVRRLTPLREQWIRQLLNAQGDGTLPSAPGIPTPVPEIPAPAIHGLAPGTTARTADPPPKTTQHPPTAGTTVVLEPERKSIHRPAPTTSRETKAADITSGTCLLHNDRLPLRY